VTSKPATLTASILLAAVSVAHLLRAVFGTQVTVADRLIPVWVSVVAFLVAGAVAIMLWREARRT
jgi:membrane protein implicated in regulation of membrane protease activity